MADQVALVIVNGQMERLAASDRLNVETGIVFGSNVVTITGAAGVLSFTDANGTKSLDAIPVEGSVILDFGAFPGSSNATVSVADAGIKSGSITTAKILPIATSDHSADEHVADPPAVYADTVVAGVGFTVRGSFTQQLGGRTYGKWTVAWSRT